MTLWTVGYLSVGVLLYLGLWMWAASRGHNDLSDELFLGVTSVALIAFWPVVTPFFVKLILEDPSQPTPVQDEGQEAAMKGTRGVAVSNLQPAGEIEIDGKRYQALANHGTIERGAAVEVVDRDDLRVKVKRCDSSGV